MDQQRTYDMVKEWRTVVDEYHDKVLMMEAYTNMSMTMKYYLYGAHFPFNFGLITQTNKDSKAADFKSVIDDWMLNMPFVTGTANWVVSRMRRRFKCHLTRATVFFFFELVKILIVLFYIREVWNFFVSTAIIYLLLATWIFWNLETWNRISRKNILNILYLFLFQVVKFIVFFYITLQFEMSSCLISFDFNF